MLGVWRSSAKTYVLGAEMALLMRSAAERGEVADLERRIKDSRALRAFCCVGSIAMEKHAESVILGFG